MSALGFILPFFPIYLGERGVSDQALGIIWTIAAATSMIQIHVGRLSDRRGRRQPILLVSLVVLALAGLAIPHTTSILLLGLLVIIFSENGLARSLIENLSGAEVSAQAKDGEEGRALSALRFFRPAGIVIVSLGGGWLAERTSLSEVFVVVVAIQVIAIFGILFMKRDAKTDDVDAAPLSSSNGPQSRSMVGLGPDKAIWFFVTAMVLFHAANAPQGIYYGLFMVRDLHFTESFVALTIVLDMGAWLLVVLSVGWLADRYGIRPLLFVCWILLVVKTVMIAMCTDMWLIGLAKIIDGMSNGMFAVLAALWTVERLGGRRRSGEAHAIVGTSLVFGSSMGPFLASFFVEGLGYKDLFLALGSVACVAILFLFGVPDVSRQNTQDEHPDTAGA
jgi:MFS family permease